MTLDEFDDLLDRCGGDLSAWPPGAEEGAQRLLARSAEARAALGRQQEVDRWFAATRAEGASRDFAARARSAPQLPAPFRPLLVRWGAAAAMAAAALLAIGLGAATGAAHATFDEPVQALAQALAAPGEAVDAG